MPQSTGLGANSSFSMSSYRQRSDSD